MELYKQELIKIVRLEAFNHIIIFGLIIAAIIVCCILKRHKVYFVSLIISVSFLFIMVLLSVGEFIPLYRDITSNAYVTLENAYFSCGESNFDFSGFQKVSVYDGTDNPIVLKTTKRFEDNDFNGIVVYSEESKYLVYAEEM